jgi:excisionase family DNA binding protein
VERILLTVAEVADRCRVHPKTVMRAIARGELEALRLGERGAYRIRPEDLDSWLDARVVRPPRFARRVGCRSSRSRLRWVTARP